MNLIYDKNYDPKKTKYFVVHHFGGTQASQFASTIRVSVDDIEAGHTQRFGYDFYSQIINPKTGKGWRIGYNGIIFPDRFVQTRAIGEETAAQRGYNFDGVAVSFCIAGNFTSDGEGSTVDKMTDFQLQTLRELKEIFPQVALANVVPHRVLQQTQCYGTGLDDNWARKLVTVPPVVTITNPKTGEVEELKLKISLLMRIQQLLAIMIELKRKLMFGFAYGFGSKLGSVARDCADIEIRG